MQNLLPVVATGIVSSILTEIFKLIPALRQNAVVTSIVAIVVTAAAIWVENGLTWSLDNFLVCLASAFISYKTFIEPVATLAGSPSQE